MQFASLGSGSRGNATLIRYQSTTLLVDCGFSLKETEQRLARVGLLAEQIDGIFVTHEHGDHIRGVGAFARRHKTPVWMTHGTERSAEMGTIPNGFELIIGEAVQVGEIEVLPYSVPHDAAEPCQFLFSNGKHKLGLLTDAGMITPHIIQTLSGIDAILLECNHDIDMLLDGEYPPYLKERVASDYGHLNNHQAADLLVKMDTTRLEKIVVLHISDKNNDPILARQALAEAVDWDSDDICVAHQSDGLDWMSLN
ncbi:Metal-dependent hydrolases of the beta-lactamase superfamily I [hydrothermal vent metagenome]|uniref:Metal-dependent hydrolases of the beta-lactamase superfamily I n=1 Tax=hydrothermal vent metagenome TaxID=652676 RepID=A0A3B1ATH7_9ZZZZ